MEEAQDKATAGARSSYAQSQQTTQRGGRFPRLHQSQSRRSERRCAKPPVPTFAIDIARVIISVLRRDTLEVLILVFALAQRPALSHFVLD